ncbi:unnamed protein product [Tuber melanosporum]|uniref:(Perigord truffle) hypothetical protein n=1 Tax=Tuber melanosporum (strain Mel28) TaxID=656061 RepID=D5GEX7_TUBMM|nr:uncharacterized protein GSTUM_00006634001 [Tuber melanosporum]CAZ83070.1 unnamed protein product [Tuber melanosporum]
MTPMIVSFHDIILYFTLFSPVFWISFSSMPRAGQERRIFKFICIVVVLYRICGLRLHI